VSRLLAAEVLKIRTIRTGYWLALASLALVAVATMSVVGSEAADVLAALNEQRQVLRIAGIADVFAFLLGVVIVGGEQSHGTITQTFLVEPVRERVVVAKALVAAAVGAVLAAAAVVVVIAIAAPWLSTKGIHFELGDGGLRRIVLGTVLAAALVGPLGVGWGAIFRRQGAAIGAALVYLLIGENILQPLLGDNREYSPASAFAAVVNAARESGPNDDLLALWPGALLSAAYATAFLVAGAAILARRDV
jgi:ABC-2 type transport system permease protein